MDLNNSQSQGYYFVLREDQSNNVYNFAIPNAQIPGQEARYIVDTGEHRYIHVSEAAGPPASPPLESPPPGDKNAPSLPKDEDFWDRVKIRLLLTLCLENELRNSNKDKSVWNELKTSEKDKNLWNEISSIVGASSEECSKKYRNLRRTYIRLLKKKKLGKDTKWVHFNICEELFKDSKSLPPSILTPWEDAKVRRLLSLYIENLSKFRSSECLQKDIWKDIASALGTTEYNCYHKFKNLKRTYFKWMERSHATGNLIKWPYQQYFDRIFCNYQPTQGTWDRNKTMRLIQAYSQIAHKFRNPRYQKKELWKEISALVGESPSSCDRKFRNLKQTFIRLRMKTVAGLGSSGRWRYYKEFQQIYDNSIYGGNEDEGEKSYYSHYDNYVEQLLTYYLENKEKFSDPFVKKKYVWKQIASKLGLSPEECSKKFRNLKQTYIRLKEKLVAGKTITWPYFALCEQIYNEPEALPAACEDFDRPTMLELKKVLRDMQEKKDLIKFEQLVSVVEESNDIQRERNRILQALLDRKQ